MITLFSDLLKASDKITIEVFNDLCNLLTGSPKKFVVEAKIYATPNMSSLDDLYLMELFIGIILLRTLKGGLCFCLTSSELHFLPESNILDI